MKTKSRMKPTEYSSSNTNSDINKIHNTNTNINNARSDDTNNSDYEHISHIEKKIKSGAFKIAVYGLGHIGSALASVWLRQGAHVIGVDKSSKVLENAKIGKTHLLEPGVNEAFTQGIEDDRFEVYEDLVKASLDSYFKMICVPVLATNGSADLTAIKDVAKSIGKGLKKFDVVALNPSVPPGTTEEVVLPILEKESGFKAETDFYMIYNPERIYEGRAIEDIEQRYPAIVSGVGVRSLNIGTKIYSIIFKKGVIAMSSIRTAETEKLLEGVYRDVNIALANELAKFCEKVGIDFWEARDAANSQPFCHIHKPGVGVGGACIPVYPQFILHTADQINIDCNITRMGRNINDSMPAYSVERATELLKEQEEKNNRKKQGKEHLEKDFVNKGELIITLLGLAFRGGVSDTRLSPTYKVIEEFQKLKVKEIRIHDPLIINDPSLSGKQNIILTSNLNEAIQGTDLVMLIADHPEYRTLTPDDLGGAPIYDGRGILDRSKFDHSTFASIGVG
jgi:nucleotide sugar dehydrogenase